MAHVIVHAGIHKTGSSFIQNTLFKNRETLAQHGVLYPLTGIRQKAPSRGRSHRAFRHFDAAGPAFAKLQNEITQSGARTVVLSYEALFRPGVAPETLRQGLAGHETTLLLYVRNPVDYIESKYRQWVRHPGFAGEPTQFLEKQLPYLHLFADLPRWQEVFDGRLVVKSFDHIAYPNLLANEVLEAGGHKVPDLEPSRLRNPSDTNATTLLRLVIHQRRRKNIDLAEGLKRASHYHYPGVDGRLLDDAAIASVMEAGWAPYEAAMRMAGYAAGAPSKWAGREFDAAFFDPRVRADAERFLLRARRHERFIATREAFKGNARRTVRRLLGRA